MHSRQIENGLFVFAFLFFVLSVKASYAYFDPGTGSYILQVTAAFLFGGLFIVKAGWKQIKEFFAKLFGRNGK